VAGHWKNRAAPLRRANQDAQVATPQQFTSVGHTAKQHKQSRVGGSNKSQQQPSDHQTNTQG